MNKIMKNVGKTLLFHGLFPFVYKWYSKKNVEKNQVLFIEIRYAELTDNFTLLYEEFCRRTGFTVNTVFLGNSVFSYKEYIKACFGMLRHLAVAEYVFVDESSNVLAALPIRKETKMIQTWHGCGAFKRFGYEGMSDLKEKYYNDYHMVTVSSPEVVDIYANSMGQKKDIVLPIGVSRTDVFFDKEYIDAGKNSIRKKYNIPESKRVILYAPTFRGNVQEAQSPSLLDVKSMYEGLGEDYVILFKGHPAVKSSPDISELYSHFFIDAAEEKIETLMCASDCCITDYSSLVFEYSLLDKPMFFYAYDYREYVTERGFYYEYDKFVPGGIYFDEKELIQGILSQNDGYAAKIQDFRDKFMSSCDGHSTIRIIEKMLAM